MNPELLKALFNYAQARKKAAEQYDVHGDFHKG